MDHSKTKFRFAFLFHENDTRPIIASEWDCHKMRNGIFDMIPWGKYLAIIDMMYPRRVEWEKPLMLTRDEAQSILKWDKEYLIVTHNPDKVTFNTPTGDLRDMPWDDFVALTGP